MSGRVVVVNSHYFRSCFFNVACTTSSWEASSPGASGPRVISLILCGYGYCRGSQGMTPWMVNAVNFSEGRINRKTKPHLQTFPNEVKTQSCGLKRRRAADVGSWKSNKNGPTPASPCIYVPYGTKKKYAALVQIKQKKI